MKALNEKQLKMLQDLEGLTKEVKLLSDSLGHKFGDTSCNTTKVSRISLSYATGYCFRHSTESSVCSHLKFPK